MFFGVKDAQAIFASLPEYLFQIYGLACLDLRVKDAQANLPNFLQYLLLIFGVRYVELILESKMLRRALQVFLSIFSRFIACLDRIAWYVQANLPISFPLSNYKSYLLSGLNANVIMNAASLLIHCKTWFSSDWANRPGSGYAYRNLPALLERREIMKP